MAEITCLGYYVIGARDLDAWKNFAVDILGLQVGYEDHEMLLLRMDDHEQRVVVEKSDLDDLAGVGWYFDNALELEQYVKELSSKGVDVKDGGQELAQRRRVKKVYVAEDQIGIRQEFYFGPALAPVTEPFQSKVMTGAGFVTGRVGIGHFVPVGKDYETHVDFYLNKLGLKVTDYIQMELSPGNIAETTFLHTKTGRHHTVAAMAMPGFKKRIRHIMFQTNDLFDVGMAYDRARNGGCLAKELGQHTNDRMLSFYIWSPSGFQIEYGWGGIQVNDENWDTKVHTEASSWGHRPLDGGII